MNLKATVLSLGLSTVCCAFVSAQGFPDFFNGGQDGFGSEQFQQMMFGPPSEEELEALESIEISIKEEREYGTQLVDSFLQARRADGIEFIERGPRVEYLRELVAKIHPLMDNHDRYRRLRVIVADLDEVDAMSFPGGTLIFTKGLIEFCDNEAALLGVIGHELSHIDRGHQLLPLKRSKMAQESFSGAQGFDPRRMMRTFSVMSDAWMRPFHPEDETAADSDGALWAFELGFDPREFAKVFLRLSDRRTTTDEDTPAFLRTHPFDEDRYRAVVEVYDTLRATSPDRDLVLGAESHQEKLEGFR